MRGAEVGAVGGVGLGGLGAICKGTEAYTAASGHVDILRYLVCAILYTAIDVGMKSRCYLRIGHVTQALIGKVDKG